ncbi:MAG: phospholipase D family protein [Anaerolineae bacterium]
MLRAIQRRLRPAMMLDPDDRSLLTTHLAPPPGFVFDAGLATTYTLDPTLLLTVPLHLSGLGQLAGRGGGRGGLVEGDPRGQVGEAPVPQLPADPIALLEALRRVTERFTVYTDRGGIHPARLPSPLYSLLEPMVVEVRAPNGGAFHAKLWLLRFADPSGADRRLRLLVSTRNITADASWDMALAMDGTVRGDDDEAAQGVTAAAGLAGAPLTELLVRLPDFARALPAERRALTEALAADVLRTRWELPPGIADVRFHVLGLTDSGWLPARSDRMAVIGPFLGDRALADLCATTRRAVLLVSRADALAATKQDVLTRFERCCTLDAASESEDGADESGGDSAAPEGAADDASDAGAGADSSARATPADPASFRQRGLHAKVLMTAQGGTSRVYVGSANPTNAALCFGRNVEIMAELSGPSRQIGDPERLGDPGPSSLGRLFVDWTPGAADAAPSAAALEAERSLAAARRAVADAGLRVACTNDGDQWTLTLVPQGPMPLAGIASWRAWPITIGTSHAQDVSTLQNGQPAWLCAVAAANVTGLIAFELTSAWRPPDGATPPVLRFAVNLALLGAPKDRTGELLRAVLADQRGFLRYLMILLGHDAPLALTAMVMSLGGTDSSSEPWRMAPDSLPLLEAMTRAFVHRPEQIRSIESLVRDITGRSAGSDIIPPAFVDLWTVYAKAMGGKRR